MEMSTEGKDAVYIAATAGVIFLLWWVMRRNQPAAIPAATTPSQEGFPIPYGAPMDNVYTADPTAYEPASNADLTLNVDNPYASMLNDSYIPLFGFVGVAQGMQL
jgi:hypothetical protein